MKWRREIAALSVDIAKFDGNWWIVVPKLSTELMKIVRNGIERYELQVEELARKIQPAYIRLFKEALNTPNKYKVIDEIAKRFHVSNEAAILFLGEIKAEQK